MISESSKNLILGTSFILALASLSACSTLKSTAVNATEKVVSAGSAVGSGVYNAGSKIVTAGTAVGSAVGNAVGSTVIAAGNNVTTTMSAANSNLGSAVSATVSTAGSTLGSTVDFTALTVGELTGITTLIKAGAKMTPRESYQLGRMCAAKVLSDSPPVNSERLADYVNTLGRYLSLHSQNPELYKGYHFVVTEGTAPTAMSTPGGFIFISAGMLTLAESEDELAAVLAHEIAHISLMHAEEAIQTESRMDLLGGALLKTASFATNFVTETTRLDKVELLEDLQILKVLKIFDAVTDFVLNTGFNQMQELDADQEAVQILKSAGYSPSAVADIIAKTADNTTLMGFHPGSGERIRAVKRTVNQWRLPATEATSYENIEKHRKRFLSFKDKLKPRDVVEDRY